MFSSASTALYMVPIVWIYDRLLAIMSTMLHTDYQISLTSYHIHLVCSRLLPYRFWIQMELDGIIITFSCCLPIKEDLYISSKHTMFIPNTHFINSINYKYVCIYMTQHNSKRTYIQTRKVVVLLRHEISLNVKCKIVKFSGCGFCDYELASI